MQLFRIQAESEGKNGLPEYVDNHYISFGRPGVGDLSQLDMAELEKKLVEAYRLEGPELQRQAEEHYCFAHVMQDGDYVIASDGERMYLGDLGDYYYLDDFDNAQDHSGHRRGVTWLQSLQSEELHVELLAFLKQEGKIGMFGRPVSREQLEPMLVKQASPGPRLVDDATIREALDILKAAMRSEDAHRRERAAIAILQVAQLEQR